MPHKKAPQIMLDLFNAVEQWSPGNQEKFEGNVVRSFEDRGKNNDFSLRSHMDPISTRDGKSSTSHKWCPSGFAGFLTARRIMEFSHVTTPDSPKVSPQDSRSRRKCAAPSYPRSRPMSCQRIPLFVDFEVIGWAGWIISPRGYNAYYCKSSCPFPLGKSFRATNLATLQSVMHALKLFNEEENVVLKQYDDTVSF